MQKQFNIRPGFLLDVAGVVGRENSYKMAESNVLHRVRPSVLSSNFVSCAI